MATGTINIYRYQFTCKCPVNKRDVIYSLFIESTLTIYVEDLINHINTHVKAYHEELADDLFVAFGGQQVLLAHHHGVDIETRRGFP